MCMWAYGHLCVCALALREGVALQKSQILTDTVTLYPCDASVRAFD